MSTPEHILNQTGVVIAHWQSELQKKGLPAIVVRADSARFEKQLDPSDQSESWFGEWRDRSGMKQGEITLREDGKVFCEYDVLKPHPKKKGMWVEAITSWGDIDALKTELRLLPIPE